MAHNFEVLRDEEEYIVVLEELDSNNKPMIVVLNKIDKLEDRQYVEDLKKSPIFGVVVRVQGTLVGSTVDQTTVSGVSPAFGKSGFEFVLGEAPLPSDNTLYIRLFDQAGVPLSDEIRFSTSAECDKNLVLIRFRQVR